MSGTVEFSHLAKDLKICRILNGMWQTAGGHGQIRPGDAIGQMLEYHEAGLTTWDMADIYGPAEEFFGEFRKMLKKTGERRSLRTCRASQNLSQTRAR